VISCDAIVVGGGPAGSTCAWDLTRAGARVVVVDRAVFPRDKCCAGWITPQVVQALAFDPCAYARSHTIQPITAFATSTIGAPALTTAFSRVVSYAIRRCEFDHFLLERSGAILLTRPVQRPERRRGRWVVADAVEAPMLVGAGGHFCPVARMLNAVRDAGPVVVAQETEFRLAPPDAARNPVRGDTPELFFCSDRRGYGWCVRKDDYLNIGFGRLGAAGFRQQVVDFVTRLKTSHKVPDRLPEHWPGHAYRIYARPMRQMVDDGVILVGDAAGLAHPVSGEGILTAVESGRLAAKVIAAAGSDYTARRLAGYAALVEQRYGRPASSADEPWMLPSALVSWVGVRLMAMPWFARHVLLGHWFLHHRLSPLPV
jgi:flavin-dependent dehydrogenase